MIRVSPFLKDFLQTGLSSVIVMISYVGVYHLLAAGLSVDDFGAYLISRRFISTLFPVTTLCMGIAITRYISITSEQDSKEVILFYGFILSVAPCLFIYILGVSLDETLSELIFQSSDYSNVFSATLFFLLGYSIYSVLYAYYRGDDKIIKANYWNAICGGIAPIAICFIFADLGEASLILYWIGGFYYFALIPLIPPLIRYLKKLTGEYSIESHKNRFIELIKYGLPRVPSGILIAGLLSIGPFWASSMLSVREGGFLALALSVVGMVSAVTLPMGIVLLPKIGRLMSEGKKETIQSGLSEIISFSFYLGIFSTLHLIIWADEIVKLWFGPEYTEVVFLMRVSLFALTPYLILTMLGPCVDAVERKAINTRNNSISLSIVFILLVLSTINDYGIVGINISVLMGFVISAALAVRFLNIKYPINFRNISFVNCLSINILFFVVGLLGKYGIEKITTGIGYLLIGIVLELLLLFAYYALLWKQEVSWTLEIGGRIFKPAASSS